MTAPEKATFAPPISPDREKAIAAERVSSQPLPLATIIADQRRKMDAVRSPEFTKLREHNSATARIFLDENNQVRLYAFNSGRYFHYTLRLQFAGLAVENLVIVPEKSRIEVWTKMQQIIKNNLLDQTDSLDVDDILARIAPDYPDDWRQALMQYNKSNPGLSNEGAT